MAQSVKLKDGSYIDTSGIWDSNAQKTVEQVYADTKNIIHSGVISFTVSKADTWTYDEDHLFTLSKGLYLIAFKTATNCAGHLFADLATTAGEQLQTLNSMVIVPTSVSVYKTNQTTAAYEVKDDALTIKAGFYFVSTANSTVTYEIQCLKLL